MALVKQRDRAQKTLEQAYPKLFITNEEISHAKRTARAELEGDGVFKRLGDERAAAWKAQQTYLRNHDLKLAELELQMAVEIAAENSPGD